MSRRKPPRLAQILLGVVAPRRDRHFMIHDLDEEFQVQISEGRSVTQMRRWYWHQVLVSVPSCLKRGWGGWSYDSRHSVTLLSSLAQDIRHAGRRIRTHPRFVVPAVLTLALGIGANAVLYSVVNTVLLRSLPYRQPDQLITIWESNPEVGQIQSRVSPPIVVDLQRDTEVFSHVVATAQNSFELMGGPHPQQVSAMMASPEVFSLLGVGMTAGTGFAAEAREPGKNYVVVLSFAFWQRWFGADRRAIGATLELDGNDYEVVGVLPEDFWFPESAELWAPLTFAPAELSEGMRGARYLQVYARLKPEVSIEQARSELAVIGHELGAVHANNAGWTFELKHLHDHLVQEYRRPLLLLLVAAGFVLCIACANVANLVLVRSVESEQELQVRAALGASRWRLLRASLVENALLALLGGAVGVVVAFWVVRPVIRLAPAGIPRLDEVTLDSNVLVFCVAVSMFVGFVLTLVSSVHRGSHDLRAAMQASGARTGDKSTHRLRQSLIVVEVALSLVLLIGAGLMLQSFTRLSRVDPGFQSHDVMTLSLSLPRGRYAAPEDQVMFYRDLLRAFATVDGVRSVAATTNLPLAGSAMRFGFGIDEVSDASLNQQLRAEYHATSPGYFRTMGIALRGRPFVDADDSSGRPVAIINESMARRFWRDADPLGELITVVSQHGPVSREIVGVVGDVRHAGLASDPGWEVYVPLAQDPWPFVTVAMKTTEEESGLVTVLRDRLAALDRSLPMSSILPMDRHIAEWLGPVRFQMVLIGTSASLAFMMALMGMYGVISYVVGERRKEIGIRIALGADRRDVFQGVAGQAATLAATGVLAGLAAASVVTRSLGAFLYEVSPTDPPTFFAIVVLVLLVSVMACVVPAARAARVDPAEALRGE